MVKFSYMTYFNRELLNYIILVRLEKNFNILPYVKSWKYFCGTTVKNCLPTVILAWYAGSAGYESSRSHEIVGGRPVKVTGVCIRDNDMKGETICLTRCIWKTVNIDSITISWGSVLIALCFFISIRLSKFPKNFQIVA